MSEETEITGGVGAVSYWSTEGILPSGFLPMLPTAAAGPLDSLDYAYEVRWEGLRLLAGLEGPKISFRTGAGQDPSFWFPELAEIRAAVQPSWALLDGELVVLEGGKISPAALRRRMSVQEPDAVAAMAEELPVRFMVYDVLRIGDSWLLDVNWDERRDILTRVIGRSDTVRVSPTFPEGSEALNLARQLGLEAVMAKRMRGRYTPGEKTRDWLNIKPMEVVEAVICGWMEGRGARGGTIGSLLLGQYRGEELVYIGHTGTGIDAETLPRLYKDLGRRGRRTCPFRQEPALNSPPNWVRPELRCRVRHQGWTDAGKMRGPTFLGMLEDDRAPVSVSKRAAAAR